METVFTILIILIPIAFKLIGKKLEQAGQEPVLSEHPLMQEVQEPVVKVKKQPKPQKKEVPVAKVSTPIANEEQQKEKEKIDPKKLVIYSEIMKPKYNE